MQKIFIPNRKNQKIAVIIDQSENPKGLAFVMHGLGGFKEQPHIATFAQSFQDAGYTAVRFDTTNTFGESDGSYEDATTTNYYEDLEDVIGWAKTQTFYQEPFFLTGHSLGGICVALYAEKYPEKIKGLAPISTVVSGKLSYESPKYKKIAKEWERTGWRVTESSSQPGLIKRLKWSHTADRLKYDLLPEANKLMIPVLMIVGDQDDSTLLEHQKILYDILNCPKELHIIKGAPHTFKDPNHLKELKEIFDQWIKKI
ncbi:MAG TPA: alpha/beta fold hydrolase [Patescibacteria group bacterium]|nr:alpha/beta fold hydrolase [Patescibacteria group bacterium]